MKLYKLLPFILLTGCMTRFIAPKAVSIDPELQPYINEFLIDARVNGVNVVIDDLIVKFASNLGTDILGDCYMNDRGQDGPPLVQISIDEWPTLGPYQRQSLLFHELGHCVFWYEHDQSWVTTPLGDYIPKSIMFPYIEPENIMETYWNYYVIEFFTGQEVFSTLTGKPTREYIKTVARRKAM